MLTVCECKLSPSRTRLALLKTWSVFIGTLSRRAACTGPCALILLFIFYRKCGLGILLVHGPPFPLMLTGMSPWKPVWLNRVDLARRCGWRGQICGMWGAVGPPGSTGRSHLSPCHLTVPQNKCWLLAGSAQLHHPTKSNSAWRICWGLRPGQGTARPHSSHPPWTTSAVKTLNRAFQRRSIVNHSPRQKAKKCVHVCVCSVYVHVCVWCVIVCMCKLAWCVSNVYSCGCV